MTELTKRHIVRATWRPKLQTLLTVDARDSEHSISLAKHHAVLTKHLFEKSSDADILEEDIEIEHLSCVDDEKEEEDAEVEYWAFIDCPKCDNNASLPADEQRWHMADFVHIENLDESVGYVGTAVYRCGVCGCPAISEIQAVTPEDRGC